MALIDNGRNFIFIHVRKTGGTSIVNCLKNQKKFKIGEFKNNESYGLSLAHHTSKQIEKKYPTEWEKYFTFAFVRNPWDRLVSRYFWSKDSQKVLLPKECSTFKKFVERVYNNQKIYIPKYNNRNVGLYKGVGELVPQYDILYSDLKGSKLDYIGKYENLQDDFDIICDKLNIDKKILPHDNKTNHTPYWEYYDEDSKLMVEEKYKLDIDNFGYRFK